MTTTRWCTCLIALALTTSANSAAQDEPNRTRSRSLIGKAYDALVDVAREDRLREEALELAYRARDEEAAGNPELARALLKQARISWPELPQLTHALADLYDRDGRPTEALDWYVDAAALGEPFRAHYTSGQIRYELAEAALAEADIPADADAFPTQPEDAQVAAINEGMEALARARDDFLDGLLERGDPRASESVAAISKRLDELQEMLDKIEPEENPEDEQQDGDDESDEDQDQNEPDDNEDGDENGDENQQPPEGEDPPEDGDQDQQPQGPPPQTEPITKQDLSPEQIQRLVDKLEELQERAAMLDRQARRREREPGERDW